MQLAGLHNLLFGKMPQSSTLPRYKVKWSGCEHKELLKDIIERGELRNLSLGNQIKEKPEVYGNLVLDPYQKCQMQNKVNEFKNFPKKLQKSSSQDSWRNTRPRYDNSKCSRVILHNTFTTTQLRILWES